MTGDRLASKNLVGETLVTKRHGKRSAKTLRYLCLKFGSMVMEKVCINDVMNFDQVIMKKVCDGNVTGDLLTYEEVRWERIWTNGNGESLRPQFQNTGTPPRKQKKRLGLRHLNLDQ